MSITTTGMRTLMSMIKAMITKAAIITITRRRLVRAALSPLRSG